jgi:citrate lyase subunit beta/citryl-CoA lyase
MLVPKLVLYNVPGFGRIFVSTRPTRLRRSELATPGSNEKMMIAAASSAADLVFLDLEDAVAPGLKAKARSLVVAALNELDWGNKTRAVRINGTDTPWCLDDLLEVVGGAGDRVDVIIVPKVRGARDVYFIETLLEQLEFKFGLEPGRIGIEVLIEEVTGLAKVDEIAASSKRLEALILGFGDLSASQGVAAKAVAGGSDLYHGDIWHYARVRMIVAARANGIAAIDGPFADYRDDAGYRREAISSVTLGAVGKWAIHPNQIPIANEIFAPSAEEIAQAQAMIAAVREAEARGHGASTVAGVLVDAATIRMFEEVLAKAQQINGTILTPVSQPMLVK